MKWFEDALLHWNIPITIPQLRQFDTYCQFLLSKNQVMNLTAITEPSEVYRKHFLDSLSLTQAMSLEGKTLLDVGAGAGFPSIPCKIIVPSLQVHIIDSLGKRITFLEELASLLGIQIQATHGRVEELPKTSLYDIVTARAVARLSILLELCLPFAKVGGVFVAMKSMDYVQELSESKEAITLLGGVLEQVVPYSIEGDDKRVLLVFRKINPTPIIYPRSFGKIKAKPL
ncbi:MAG: 16S rRNA (guanine(527)-N(7))-methyltransferase RsmG [Candidatus Izemoplasmatales bacterium]|nr:16S rRNA (guanine(527)-N(7))-methyltransferase RsmG [bacterium]MDZ4196724.1 16S rRNA (guanine(527)-N(7))-methyltransferase RsmG [Candidatus Izemoplasmatales bacterium]